MAHVLRDLHLGATDSVTVTLTWAVLYMTQHPTVQAKVCRLIREFNSSFYLYTSDYIFNANLHYLYLICISYAITVLYL